MYFRLKCLAPLINIKFECNEEIVMLVRLLAALLWK